MTGQDSETEPLAAVLEAESAALAAMADEVKNETDPAILEQYRLRRDEYLERVQQLNEHLAKLMPD